MAEQISSEAFARVLRGRRTIDLFLPEPVSSDVLREAIDVARWAPNHRLTEPWHFYLIGQTAKTAITELAVELDTAAKGERAGAARRERLKGVPGFFVLTSRRSDDNALLDKEDYAACCCAAENLMLYLWQRGIGVKWTTGGIIRNARLYELLGIDPSREVIVGLFWYGTPKIIPEQKRRAVSEIVTERP